MKFMGINLSQEIKFLLSLLPKREQDIITRRFGLFNKNQETLDSIGRYYNITRERVRQIQDHGLNVLKNKIIPANPKFNKYFNNINQKIEEIGGIVKEGRLVNILKKKEEDKNYLNFLFVLNKEINFYKENNNFHSRWVSQKRKEDLPKIENAVNALVSSTAPNQVVSYDDILKNFQSKLKSVAYKEIIEDKNILCSWIEISRYLDKNIFGEWGNISSYHINPKGIKDYAYLSMRRHGSPMHFKEVSRSIEEHFKKPAHIQTVHNELIKDNRFVLVGRGLYALKEWGYIPGTVKDVIKNIISGAGKISKEELVKRILKERHVKETTIAINLQNKNVFRKHQDGTYGLL